MRHLLWISWVLALASSVLAADFGHPGGPPIKNGAQVVSALQREAYDLELMLSFGTSKVGSGGHLALAVRNGDVETVYSANFYADRAPAHQAGHYTADLMCKIPKAEYLFGTESTISPQASFGLDFGEVFKRSVIGVRAFGVPAAEKAALVAFFERLNDDYRKDLPKTEYHDGRILYGYMDLNCAKTVGAAFRHGAGYTDVKLKGNGALAGLNPVKALKANLPMAIAMKVVTAWAKRGYAMDTVMYKKWEGSTFVDDSLKTTFAELPNRFPSFLSLDYAEGETHYEDYDNLLAMNLLVNMGRHSIELDGASQELKVTTVEPMPHARALEQASADASKDSKAFVRRIFRAWGVRLFAQNDNRKLYDFAEGEP